MKPHRTNDYTMLNPGMNRKLSESHVTKVLMPSMREHGFLKSQAILVRPGEDTVDYTIVDGHHRYEAAKRLGIAYYYMVDENADDDLTWMINTKQKPWGMNDYLHYWADRRGLSQYQELLRDMGEDFKDIPKMLVIGIGTGATVNPSPELRADFKEGRYRYTHRAELVDLLEKLKDFETPFYKEVYNAQFIHAVRVCMKHPDYDHDRMVKQIQRQADKLTKQVNARSFVALLQHIYNYRYTARNGIDFLGGMLGNR